MVCRGHLWLHRVAVLFALCLALSYAPTALASPPVMVSAVSRLQHGAGGPLFDIQLPQAFPYGCECRVSTTTTLVITFDQNITGGTAAVTAGTATAGTPSFA